MEKYIKEVSGQGENGEKQFVLLVNKADYLTEELISHWNTYFKEKGIEHIFFSALEEQVKIDNGDLDVSEDEESDEEEDENADAAAMDMEELK